MPTTFLDNTPYIQPSTVDTDIHSASSSRSSFVPSVSHPGGAIIVSLFCMFMHLL